ncbi:MAG: hypothetical protein K1X75_00195 [Leptospirales bacterium]|nr:hypothetical protein [Leptospirales bacterium]
MNSKGRPESEELLLLKQRLARFLEIHLKTRLLEANDGALKMQTLFARNNVKSRPKDKLINYLLAEVQKRLLDGPSPDRRDLIICEFLIEELEKFVAASLKRP